MIEVVDKKKPSCLNLFIGRIFPPKVFKIKDHKPEPVVAHHDPFHLPVTEDGIVWRGYDVRMTGIERMEQDHP